MSFFARLKEERKRLKLTQTEFAAYAGVTKKSQGVYESGKVYPGADYLEKLTQIGVDVQYVLSGIRSNSVLASEERELLELYRRASLPAKAAAYAALRAETPGHNIIGVNGPVSGGMIAVTIQDGSGRR